MFTGIIEELGTVISLRREANVGRLALQAHLIRDDLHIGDSLATNGACLTVERIEPEELQLTMMPVTMQRTTLGSLKPGDKVNLERAVRANGRLGGHILAGHVDGVGTVTRITGVGEERVYTITIPRDLLQYIAPQGSIAIDGISLTVVDVLQDAISVSLIRHTLSMTTLAYRSPGSKVNIEVDLLARYLDRLITSREEGQGLSLEKLRDLGY
ncbi:MAG TPA: riboflavin synthase [Armatimonadota bacterium]|nr:riboflavin synthase [Armatimonadota bacterium]